MCSVGSTGGGVQTTELSPHSRLGFIQPLYDSLREPKQKHREEMEPTSLTADIFLDSCAYDLLSSGMQCLQGL